MKSGKRTGERRFLESIVKAVRFAPRETQLRSTDVTRSNRPLLGRPDVVLKSLPLKSHKKMILWYLWLNRSLLLSHSVREHRLLQVADPMVVQTRSVRIREVRGNDIAVRTSNLELVIEFPRYPLIGLESLREYIATILNPRKSISSNT